MPLPAGTAPLPGGRSGAVTVLDLDGVIRPVAAGGSGGGRPGQGPVVGVARGHLDDAQLDLTRSLTFTLVPHRSNPRNAQLVEVEDVDASLKNLLTRTTAAPRASAVADQLLRLVGTVLGSDDVPETERVEQGVLAESLAYSMLLAGPEFDRWRRSRPRRRVTRPATLVRVERHGQVLEVVLNHPARRNAFSGALCLELLDALHLAEIDPGVTEVRLSGAGPCFSSGGDLDEFGTFEDPVTAHAVRLAYSAGLAVRRLHDRVSARVHGPCFGAGVEVPAFATRVSAAPDTTFCLPELELGLVPGAGGTVSLTGRIGRWRTAYLVLSAAPITARTALDWGLVDAVE